MVSTSGTPRGAPGLPRWLTHGVHNVRRVGRAGLRMGYARYPVLAELARARARQSTHAYRVGSCMGLPAHPAPAELACPSGTRGTPRLGHMTHLVPVKLSRAWAMRYTPRLVVLAHTWHAVHPYGLLAWPVQFSRLVLTLVLDQL